MPTTYCVYMARDDQHELDPPIDMGDTICVDCPDDGDCPSPSLGVISLRDRKGNVATVRARNVSGSDCRGCPRGGKTGYTFEDEGDEERRQETA